MNLDDLEAKLGEALQRDRFRLRKRFNQIKRMLNNGQPAKQRLAKLEHEVLASVESRHQRQLNQPKVNFDHSLPIHGKCDQIVSHLRERQVIVVAGETGSGKSTQLPKMCLDAGFGVGGMIGHTQPRRIAARSVAARVAEELDVQLGREVGFKIRFNDRTNPMTYVKVMTDGILLAETQSDRFLDRYDVIIVDEAHERSLNIDFLLAFLRQLTGRRPELRVIITSATIDSERFSKHFSDETGSAPIVEVTGRTYPVEIRYRPPQTDEDEFDMTSDIAAACHELASIDQGDILIFLPTERDIRETAKRLRCERLPGDGSRRTQILPLYARLSATDQNRIFHFSQYRRIVLATNVAESSLTVPGIRYVIDTGTARVSRYAPRSKVQRLPIEAVSRASADQRAGRCGRIAPGICIRLYDQQDYLRRDEYTTPEIRRTHLAAVILRAKLLKLGAVDEIPFLDPPRPEAIRDGYKTLIELSAIDKNRELTPVGRQLARMPVDPRIGRMILAADEGNCLNEVLIIAAALEVQDPRERPMDKQQQADEQHVDFLDTESDFMSYLKVWDFYQHLKQTLSRGKLRKACQQRYLSVNRLREWAEIHRQLREMAISAGMRIDARRDDYGAIHRALLTGLLSGVAYKSAEGEYTGAGGVQFVPWPGSGLRRKRHKWIIVAELLETSRRYGRTAARISPNWIEPIALHLVKRSYSDPHWHAKSASVMAYEKVSLFGMPVVSRRRIHYGKIDPVQSRCIFIQSGLVDRQADTRHEFFRNNVAVLSEIADLAAKTRRREYVIDDYSVYQFYDQRLPKDIVDVASLKRWLRRADDDQVHRLYIKMEDLVHAPNANANQFPEQLSFGSIDVPARYRFRAGEDDDGVTITVPVEAVGQLSNEQLGWLVPGLLEEKILALIRSLPKSLRTNFVPAAQTAKEVAAALDYGQGPFLSILSDKLSAMAGEPIPASQFNLDRLPEHLRINVQVVDEEGQIAASGRDLNYLREAIRNSRNDSSPSISDERWSQDGIADWNLDQLPREVKISRQGVLITAYPALMDTGQSVNMRLMHSCAAARHHTRQGVTRLYAIAKRKTLRSQVNWMPRWNEMAIAAAARIDADSLREQLQDLIADRAFIGDTLWPTSRAEFQNRLDQASERIAVATQDVTPVVTKLFDSFHKARLALEDIPSRWQYAQVDISRQINNLLSDRFLTATPWKWLCQFHQYFAAIVYRVEKLTSGGQLRDNKAVDEIDRHWQLYLAHKERFDQLGDINADLEEYRWMIEEYRISLFAQTLGTCVKVSPQRLERQLAKCN